MDTEGDTQQEVPVNREKQGPLDRFRSWRWRRSKARYVTELEGYRVPVEVCPRGCEYVESARRDLLTRTALWGRVKTKAAFSFETTNCPKCGAGLIDHCPRCEKQIFAPVADRCQFCGLPQPWAKERRAGVERASIRRWRPGERGANDPAKLLYTGERGALWVLEGDVARLGVDAVISNDDVDGQMWAEVARAIKNAAGADVGERAEDGAPYELGKAWWTPAGNIPMKGIIHVASMGRRGEQDLNIVQSCLVAALDLAAKKGYESIGTAAFGSGHRMIDLPEWLEAFANTVVDYLSRAQVGDGEDSEDLSIVLVLFESARFGKSVSILEGAVDRARESAGRVVGEPENRRVER